jgi:tetratricopeptide (TPR) repeat protein
MRFLTLIPFLLFAFHSLGQSIAQSDTVSVLLKKANGFLVDKNYKQASYYFNLAKSFNTAETKTESIDRLIESKIITSDSLHAYSCTNPKFMQVLRTADSLKSCCKIASIQKFKQASKINSQFDYPINRIKNIIRNSPEVKKQLLVIEALKNRKKYTSEIELAKFYFEKGDLYKAMRLFERTSTTFKDDTIAKGHLKRLKLQLVDEIEVFNNLVYSGDSLYKLEKFKGAKSKFEKALTIDEECNLCFIRIKSANYFISNNKQNIDWNLLKIEADTNFLIGNYEMARYQFMWLHKHNKNDLYASNKIGEIEKILKDEIDDRMMSVNARLLLEKADQEFILGNYGAAKDVYRKIENRYSKSIDYLVYVQERIKDCIYYQD